MGAPWGWAGPGVRDRRGGQRAGVVVAVHLPCAHTHSRWPGSPRNVAGSAPGPAVGPRPPWHPPSPSAAPGPAQLPPACTQTPLFTAGPWAWPPAPLCGAGRGMSCMGMPLRKTPFALQHGTVHGDTGTWRPSLQCCWPPAPKPPMSAPSTAPSLAQGQSWHSPSSQPAPLPKLDLGTSLQNRVPPCSPLCRRVLCPPTHAVLRHVLGGCPHPLWGLPVQRGPGITHWDGHSRTWWCCGHRGGVPTLRVPTCRVPTLRVPRL